MKNSTHINRLIIVSSFFSLLLIILIWRMVDLTVLHRQFLQGQGNARSLRVVDIPAHRGMIMDRNGTPLAISTPVESVWVNPKEFSPDKEQFMSLADYLNLTPQQLSRKIVDAENKGLEFLYLQRQLPPPLTKKIKALKIPGVNFQKEFKRYYPDSDSISQLIGFTNVDDQGLEGIELAYQDWLKGIVGKKRVIKDRLGRIIDELGVIKEPRPGRDMALSIDRRLQYLAYSELNKTVEEFGAKSGSVVVVDTENGEILAMANVPSYNPNSRGRYDKDTYRNRAVTDTFEPGSVIKTFSIASALETGLFTPTTIIDTNPSWMTVHGRTVRDIHNYGILDVTGVLQHSSNVGVTKMVLASPPEQLIGLLQRCGFGQRTESTYPGESEGGIVNVKDANPFVLATLSFGYGLSVTALQLAKANMVFANKGKLIPVTLLHNDPPPPGVQVIKPETAQQVLSMMEAVLGKEGTGKSARVPGYRVAGKTGTARVAGKDGYKDRRYTASFIGIAPVSKPKFVVVVIIHEPSRKGYYAAAVAAPLFAKVMSGALRLFNIPTDELVG
ncbi:penicillin-binding transpeptidase domain-containing protein [Fluoribacter dumoffii]|uniref:Peptidoglycan D,D-transpeptidase FtsI n=1 Tax=Fluoribacter dumoffii TaxID=463 RepID=A0A377G864_9GAMM|nr:penicillin-binding transpeptidase domain-containing protein [Fluoribacter dumoffii]KTC89707.1 transpeptidase involved in septal peptidoglycan synthesis (penicillin-binding protein 3) [Fluoribacter dumoffii NY 23]MCW8417963.1 penicillin-binding transpeptidase domain-containing protein [Fluoribacter dumoffii]MCW8454195.1 penicillin-binding transpeptidase domain-containing protein [Fluoribacter dumoffii]MCW8461731.1 penicillin-binding transpeptidase domain-containing protein [Fluoribacter dumof